MSAGDAVGFLTQISGTASTRNPASAGGGFGSHHAPLARQGTRTLVRQQSAPSLAAKRPPPISPASPTSPASPAGSRAAHAPSQYTQQFEAARTQQIEREARNLHDAEGYIELAYTARAGGLADTRVNAAHAFDERHVSRAGYTQQQLAELRYAPSLEGAARFGHGLFEVLTNRYAFAEAYDPYPHAAAAAPPRRKRAARRAWRLEDSIWMPRCEHGNSKAFLEDTTALHRLIDTDWHVARHHHQLAKHICATQLPAPVVKALVERGVTEKRDLTVEMPEALAVRDVLRRHAMMIYNAFDYYAALDRTPARYRGTPAFVDGAEIAFIGSNNFMTFIYDCDLEDSDCDRGQIETVWAIVDAKDLQRKETSLTPGADGLTAAERHNRVRMLNRHEWLQVLVRLAILKYCRIAPTKTDGKLTHVNSDKRVGNVAEAVDTLAAQMRATLPPSAGIDPNAFRKDHCYTEPVDMVLKAHLPSLQAMFSAYAKAGLSGRTDHALYSDTSLMSLGEWLLFIEHSGLLELGLVDGKQAAQIFAWSRIRSCGDYSAKSEVYAFGPSTMASPPPFPCAMPFSCPLNPRGPYPRLCQPPPSATHVRSVCVTCTSRTFSKVSCGWLPLSPYLRPLRSTRQARRTLAPSCSHCTTWRSAPRTTRSYRIDRQRGMPSPIRGYTSVSVTSSGSCIESLKLTATRRFRAARVSTAATTVASISWSRLLADAVSGC